MGNIFTAEKNEKTLNKKSETKTKIKQKSKSIKKNIKIKKSKIKKMKGGFKFENDELILEEDEIQKVAEINQKYGNAQWFIKLPYFEEYLREKYSDFDNQKKTWSRTHYEKFSNLFMLGTLY